MACLIVSERARAAARSCALELSLSACLPACLFVCVSLSLSRSLAVCCDCDGFGDMRMSYAPDLSSDSSTRCFWSPQLGEMRGMTDDARLHLQDMERKALMKKICLYGTIVVLSILILLVAYREITNHGRLF